jgi:large subunit ribosomal protein L10
LSLDREKKKEIVEGLRKALDGSEGTFLVNYQGLDVETLAKLRHQLKEADIDFRVAKNRLLMIASEKTDTAALKDHISGPCALAVTYDDVVMPAKILTKFSEENEELEIKVGQIDGKIIDLSGIKRLAELPSRDVLLSKLLFSLSGVATNFVRVLSEVPRSFLNVLGAIKEQKE